jgi:hypothetical protein
LAAPSIARLCRAFFWFRVARELLLGALFAALFLSLLLSLREATLAWLFGSYVAVYVTILLATFYRPECRSNTPLERTGSASRSAPER